ncbi:MAG: hypothetical protein H8E34_09555 [Bacteroidetes bacterium]|nr:hypothetical protein [Bacteroidota bacterium]MBL6942818.1 hypothetical protein [Bacteroidales bacterium]
MKQDKQHKSFATKLTRERIKILNKKLKTKISLDIIDIKDGAGEAAGTKVIFKLPTR